MLAELLGVCLGLRCEQASILVISAKDEVRLVLKGTLLLTTVAQPPEVRDVATVPGSHFCTLPPLGPVAALVKDDGGGVGKGSHLEDVRGQP